VVVGAGVVALAVIAALSIPRRRAASEVLDLDLEARADQPAAYALETAGAAGSISGL
jgi:hypothetical protein